jgi:hypothetical protein
MLASPHSVIPATPSAKVQLSRRTATVSHAARLNSSVVGTAMRLMSTSMNEDIQITNSDSSISTPNSYDPQYHNNSLHSLDATFTHHSLCPCNLTSRTATVVWPIETCREIPAHYRHGSVGKNGRTHQTIFLPGERELAIGMQVENAIESMNLGLKLRSKPNWIGQFQRRYIWLISVE